MAISLAAGIGEIDRVRAHPLAGEFGRCVSIVLSPGQHSPNPIFRDCFSDMYGIIEGV